MHQHLLPLNLSCCHSHPSPPHLTGPRLLLLGLTIHKDVPGDSADGLSSCQAVHEGCLTSTCIITTSPVTCAVMVSLQCAQRSQHASTPPHQQRTHHQYTFEALLECVQGHRLDSRQTIETLYKANNRDFVQTPAAASGREYLVNASLHLSSADNCSQGNTS